MESKNIDPIKCEKYLQNLDEKARSYAKKILANTLFFTTDGMIAMIKNSLQKFKEKHQKYNLFIPKNKIGSEHYILIELKDELQPEQIIFGTNSRQKITNDYPILIIDDAMYSSCNMCEHIDEIRYDLHINNNACIVTAIISTTNLQVLIDPYFKAEVFYDMNLDKLMAENLFFGEYDYNYMYTTFECETTCVLPLFFEHKIANVFGSYKFYHEIVDKPISREAIDQITWTDIECLVKELTK